MLSTLTLKKPDETPLFTPQRRRVVIGHRLGRAHAVVAANGIPLAHQPHTDLKLGRRHPHRLGIALSAPENRLALLEQTPPPQYRQTQP